MDCFDEIQGTADKWRIEILQGGDLDTLPLRDFRPIKGSPEESALVERLFRKYRFEGFPYVKVTDEDIREEFRLLQNTPSPLRKCVLRQSMLGLKTANAFHPAMLTVPCRGFKTPMQVFECDVLFREALMKRIRFGSNLKPWGIRKAVYSMRRTQRVSNFRPTAAKAVYQRFRPSLTVDFSAGWGGRMLGAMATDTPYIGIDPHREALDGNREMLRRVSQATGTPFNVTLIQACAEDVLGLRRWRPDLIFTSPPYFDVERYSEESSQSYLRHPNRDSWFKGFLGVCIKGAFTDLVDGGHLVLNINSDMEQETRELALEAGFIESERWEMLLSQHQYNKKSGGTYRREPILIFTKGQGAQAPVLGGILDLL